MQSVLEIVLHSTSREGRNNYHYFGRCRDVATSIRRRRCRNIIIVRALRFGARSFNTTNKTLTQAEVP